ncbi:MAG: ketopantoate reductase C-terminal domain-containing protein [Bacillota bacterium]|nr:ketopantoate reductase C-terminal domain-containing protein [Bacillota bacterium]MDW7685276.1 ketopantoate reductase C-terminal domain-containing protein [Bacillota bacterium]
MEAGRKTEVEMFAGEVCRQGKTFGIPTPVNEMLLDMIQTMEKINKRC